MRALAWAVEERTVYFDARPRPAVEAVDLSTGLKHALQDCLYLAAARRFDVPLITADRVSATVRFRSTIGSQFCTAAKVTEPRRCEPSAPPVVGQTTHCPRLAPGRLRAELTCKRIAQWRRIATSTMA